MTGSVLDGEHVVQDALFQAYRKLETFDDARPLAPWLFRIAHNRCVDFLQRRGVREEAEAGAARPDAIVLVDSPGPALGRAVEHLVLTLPPMGRACVLLKDVFDYSLEDIAKLVDSTIGGVKSALNGGPHRLGRWLANLEARAHPNVVVVALANKLVRTAWAVLQRTVTTTEDSLRMCDVRSPWAITR